MSSSATQKAVYDALKAALAPVKVFDSVPDGTAKPYVSLDAQDVAHDDLLSEVKYQRRIYLSIWSEYKGQKEVLGIVDAIEAALHSKRLPMDEGRMILATVERVRSNLDADGETYMASVTVKINTE